MKKLNEGFSEAEFEQLKEVKGDRTWQRAILDEFGVDRRGGQKCSRCGDDIDGLPGGDIRARRPSRPSATYEVKKGDLCEDCADRFADWWTQADDEAGGE